MHGRMRKRIAGRPLFFIEKTAPREQLSWFFSRILTPAGGLLKKLLEFQAIPG
jgi:hypothetical protein